MQRDESTKRLSTRFRNHHDAIIATEKRPMSESIEIV